MDGRKRGTTRVTLNNTKALFVWFSVTRVACFYSKIRSTETTRTSSGLTFIL
jgi:hypothetical protein